MIQRESVFINSYLLNKQKMGSSNSKELPSNEFLLRFSGKEHISPVDAFWNVLLSFSFKPPSSRSESELLDNKLSQIFDKLLINNLSSGNFVSLLQVFLGRSAEILASASVNNEMLLQQTHNALFIARCFTKYLVETLKEPDIIKQFSARPLEMTVPIVEQKSEPFNSKEFQDNPLETFLDALIEILVDVPLEDHTYNLHLEVINCLLVLLSVQMYTQKPAAKSVVYKNLMQGRASIHSPLLVKTLLGHFVRQGKHPEKGHSLVSGLASGLWHVLTLGYGAGSSGQELFLKASDPLANQSLLLLLVLVNHCTAEKNLRNPYREVLFTFPNSPQGPSTEPPTSAVSTFKFNLDQLYITLCMTATNECSTLLLYLLLHRNDNVKNLILARADLELLIVPILKTLYNVTDTDSHHIYMSLIILLILSEDTLFSRTVHTINLKNITWYQERALSEISLGGLLVLVVIRTIHYNMLKMRDKYLHTNCLAALANMSNNFSNLHSYVSQRILSLFETLAKKYHRLENEMKTRQDQNSSSNNTPTGDSNKPSQLQSKSESNQSNGSGDVAVNVQNHVNDNNKTAEHETVVNLTDDLQATSDLVQDLAVLEEVLRMVLEIINSCLSNQLQHNPNLIYALLYKKNIFDPFRNHPNFQDVVQNLDIVINYFSDKLKQYRSDLDVNEVSTIITQGTLQWSSHKLKKFPELKFKYVEEEQPEDFFIPYVWSLINCHSGINWSSSNVKIFLPDSEV